MREFKDFLDKDTLADGAIVNIQFNHSHERWECEVITLHLEELEKLEKQGLAPVR